MANGTQPTGLCSATAKSRSVAMELMNNSVILIRCRGARCHSKWRLHYETALKSCNRRLQVHRDKRWTCVISHDRVKIWRQFFWGVTPYYSKQEDMQTQCLIISPFLYKWIWIEVWRRKESVHTILSTLHSSRDKACIQKLNKPTQLIEIMVDGRQLKAVCAELFLKYLRKKWLPTQSSQINFDNVSFHAHTVLGTKVWSFIHT